LWTTLGGIFPDPKEIPVVMISVDIKSGEQNIANIGKSLSNFR
jgi:aromatic ring-opening dioxygenase catalytic subunit (LigB family)